MAKTKNKHGRKGIKAGKATPREVPGTRDDLYARLAGAEGQIDTLRAQNVRLVTALRSIESETLGARTGSGKAARIIAQEALVAYETGSALRPL